jgi:hypothetical protein
MSMLVMLEFILLQRSVKPSSVTDVPDINKVVIAELLVRSKNKDCSDILGHLFTLNTVND